MYINIRKILLLAFSFFLLNANSYSQVTQEWVAKYNGPVNNNDYSYDLKTDNIGNVYIAGYSQEGPPNDQDFLVIKYNSNGSQLWIRKYNGTGNNNDVAVSLALDNQGNVFATGYTRSINGANDYITIKYNTSGDSVWARIYNGDGNGNDFPRKIALDQNGNVYVTGYSIGIEDNEDYVTIKYDSLGTQQWVKRYNSTDNAYDISYDMKVDNSGNVYVTGQSLNFSTDSDYLTIKYDSNGNEIWNKRYNHAGNSIDNAYKLAFDSSGNVFVTGGTYNSTTNLGDILTIKYNSNGIFQWAKVYNGPGNDDDDGVDITINNSGNVYVLGKSTGIGTGYDYVLLKYSTIGDSIWSKRYTSGGNNDDIPSEIAIDKFNGTYITGSGFASTIDYATIKYDSSGALSWIKFYNGTANGIDIGNSIEVDSNLNVYVTGFSVESGTNGDATTIKYSQIIGIINNNEFPFIFNLN